MGSATFERDPFGPPKDALGRPGPLKKMRIVKARHRDLPVASINSGNWDYGLVAAAMAAHVQGNFALSSELCDTVLGDAKVQSALGSRIDSLLGAPVEFYRSRDGDTVMSRAVLDAWQDAWPRIAPRSVLSDIMRFSILMGFALIELKWDTSKPIWVPILKVWHPRFVWYDIVRRQYVVSTQDGPEYITPGDGTWFLLAPDGEYRGWIHGAIRPVGHAWLDRYEGARDWSRLNQRHGLPIVLVRTPADGEAGVDEDFVDAVANADGETTIHTPRGVNGEDYDVEYLEMMSTYWQGFQEFRREASNDIETAILRQFAANENSTDKRERATGGTRQSTLKFDEETLTEQIRKQVARPFAEFNFGDADLAPHTRYMIEPAEDVTANLSQLESFTRSLTALNGSGYSVDARAMARHYGVYVQGIEKNLESQPYTKPTTEISDGEVVGTGAGAPQTGVE